MNFNNKNTSVVTIDGQLCYYCINDNNEGKYYKLSGEEIVPATSIAENDEKNVESLPTEETINDNIVEEISNYLKKYVYLSEEAEYTLISILIIHSYSVDLFSKTPYLWINGEKGSGKTTLMTIMQSLVYNPVFLSETTPAALFRIIAKNKPTLFLDEVEALDRRSNRNENILKIMNSGYQKAGKVSISTGKATTNFNTFGFKILAGINTLTPTLEDRCIHLNMKKPIGKNGLERFPEENEKDTTYLINAIHGKLKDICPCIKDYIPNQLKIDDTINLRELDKWYPILAIAKSLTTETNGYFDQMQKYAIDLIVKKSKSEVLQPENSCKEILKDFLKDKSGETKIIDQDYFFFDTEAIQKVIRKNDQHNTYRDKAEFTSTLKKIGIETDRRRFGEGPVSLYKIPKSFLP